jgi:hypothetical protein
MDNNHDPKKSSSPDDLRGFEEFVESQSSEFFQAKPQAVAGNKKDTSFENFTFLTTDSSRLMKMKLLFNEKLPFMTEFEQGSVLLAEQRDEVKNTRHKIFVISDQQDSAYRRSLSEVFDSFFSQT